MTRRHPVTSHLQMVAVLRLDTGEWAIPGGMRDKEGELFTKTMMREFKEEAEKAPDPKTAAQLEELFQNQGVFVYCGYVDDPRNTDNAWMETVAHHFHCDSDLGKMLQLRATSDKVEVAKACWIDVDADRDVRYANLYASHRAMVDRVLSGEQGTWKYSGREEQNKRLVLSRSISSRDSSKRSSFKRTGSYNVSPWNDKGYTPENSVTQRHSENSVREQQVPPPSELHAQLTYVKCSVIRTPAQTSVVPHIPANCMPS